MKVTAFWGVLPSSLVDVYCSVGGISSLLLQDKTAFFSYLEAKGQDVALKCQ
jgi:hypothetical protein